MEAPAACSYLHLRSNCKELSQSLVGCQRAGRRGRRRRAKLVLYGRYTPQLRPFPSNLSITIMPVFAPVFSKSNQRKTQTTHVSLRFLFQSLLLVNFIFM